jgi:6-phosphogluconolactonase
VSAITPNPAFILKHPTLDLVYASTECIHAENCGEIVTMSVSPSDGSLTELNRVPAGGRSTCYLNVHPSKAYMTAVNYWDSIVSLLPMDGDGSLKAPIDQHLQPEASYVFQNNPDRVEHWTHRQRWPHTHCFVTEPYNKQVSLVCDLGKDIMWAYRIDADNGKLRLCAGSQMRLQQGPRHVVFHPTVRACYVVNGEFVCTFFSSDTSISFS